MDNSKQDFEILYEATKQSTLKFITSKCLNITDIEDIFQDTYIRIFDAYKKGFRADEPEAYVIGVAKHCLSSHYSVMQRLRVHISLNHGTDKDDEDPIDIGDDTDIENIVADKILCSKIYNEILDQPPDIQKMFYLRYLAGLSLDETAQALGMSESAVKQRLYKALRKLRRNYQRRELP